MITISFMQVTKQLAICPTTLKNFMYEAPVSENNKTNMVSKKFERAK